MQRMVKMILALEPEPELDARRRRARRRDLPRARAAACWRRPGDLAASRHAGGPDARRARPRRRRRRLPRRRDAERAPVRQTGAAEITVETYLHVREDALQLYGFADAAERELFLHLLAVSGIGPKVALAVVSSAPAGRAAARDRARGPRALPGDSRDRQEDRRAHRARARRRSSGARTSSRSRRCPARPRRRTSSRATRSSSSATRSSRPRPRSRAVDPELPAEERVREALRSAA